MIWQQRHLVKHPAKSSQFCSYYASCALATDGCSSLAAAVLSGVHWLPWQSADSFSASCTACSPSPALPLPSPSPPPPGQATISLISRFPPGYTSPGANLTATSPNDQCVKAPSPIEGVSANITSPGTGSCNVQPGSFGLSEDPPPGTRFEQWECYNTTTGAPLPTTPANVSLAAGQAVTCVAVYSLLPKLALLSQFPAEYDGVTANLGATSGNDSCTKAPSVRLQPPLTAAQSAAGQCGTSGYVEPGTYVLNQAAPAGTEFVRWDLYDTSSGTPVLLPANTSVSLAGSQSLTAVAVYRLPGSPSPAPPTR